MMTLSYKGFIYIPGKWQVWKKHLATKSAMKTYIEAYYFFSTARVNLFQPKG